MVIDSVVSSTGRTTVRGREEKGAFAPTRVSGIGCGHPGIPHAAAMAEIGHEVIGVDLDQAKLDRLNAGGAPHPRRGPSELLATHTASGRLRFTADIAEAAAFADVHFLAVGTPSDADGRSYDTGQVFGAGPRPGPVPGPSVGDHRQVHRHRGNHP